MLSRLIARLLADSTPFEIWWTFPALLALGLRLWLLGLVTGDVRYWQHEHTVEPMRDVEAEMIWSHSQLWHKVVLACCLALMAGFGLMAMFSPPSVQPPPPPTRVTYALTLVFVLIPTLLAMDAIQTLVSRIRTRHADDLRSANQRRRRGDMHHVEIIAEQLDKEMPS